MIILSMKQHKRCGMACLWLGLFVTLLLGMALAGCQPRDDSPPDPGTPEPPDHMGEFFGECGTLTFLENRMVHVGFSEHFAGALQDSPNNADYSYAFTWYSFGLCRYDVATEFVLYHAESETNLTFASDPAATESRISLKSALEGFDEPTVFTKTER